MTWQNDKSLAWPDKNSNTELSTFLRVWGTKHCCSRNLIQEVNIPKKQVSSKQQGGCRALFWNWRGQCRAVLVFFFFARQTPHIFPPMYVQPAHHIFHPFSRHFYCHIFMAACPSLMHRPSMCSLTYSTQGVTELSSYSNAGMPRCSQTYLKLECLHLPQNCTKCNKIVILPDFNNQISYLTSVIIFELQNLNLTLQLASAEIFFLFCCCLHRVWMSKSVYMRVGSISVTALL